MNAAVKLYHNAAGVLAMSLIAAGFRTARRAAAHKWSGMVAAATVFASRLSPSKPGFEEAAVYSGQPFQLFQVHLLVYLMRPVADQAELNHRAVILDEAGIGGAAGGRKFRVAIRLCLDGSGQQV